MPRTKRTAPRPTRDKGQRSLDLPENGYLYRIIPALLQPNWFQAKRWRSFVLNQSIAIVCRETLIAQISSMDWKVDAVDPQMRDEYKTDIDYYTKFFNNNQDYDFIEMIEWIAKDYLDLPFGGAAEIGREGDRPDGKVLWLELLDGGTLFPSYSREWPVGQRVESNPLDTVWFPKHAINRIYMSPRTEIDRKGWGMAPPEKIYLSIELLNRGDIYYANLLLDTPEAGILDLADMDKTSAEEWVKAFRSMLGGIDPLKVPILYEHDSPAKWIPFGRPPTEMMFDRITTKYASIVAGGYGMSLSDIGIQAVTSGGETLAGSIRQERRLKRTGFSRLKKKLSYFFNRLLPEHLVFNWIDLDDELGVSIGRARLATSQAGKELITLGVFTANEWRQQMVADGIITIPVPDEIDQSEVYKLSSPGSNGKSPDLLGNPVAPSAGGHGEIKTKFEMAVNQSLANLADAIESGEPDLFEFDINFDELAEEWNYLVAEEYREEFRRRIKEEFDTIWPNKFLSSAKDLNKYISLGRVGYGYVADELKNVGYNIVEDFSYNISNIVKEIKNGNDRKN